MCLNENIMTKEFTKHVHKRRYYQYMATTTVEVMSQHV